MDPNLPKYICLPGPSKRKDNNNDNHHKKQKTDEEINTKISSVTIDDLPEEILVTIFKYLSIQDRLIAQRVCNRWYEVGKSDILWKCVKLSDNSLPLLKETFRSLSSCVLHFELTPFYFFKLPCRFPQFMTKLRELCPSLKTLILRNIVFERKWNGIPDNCLKLFKNTRTYTENYMKLFLKAQIYEYAANTLEANQNQLEYEFIGDFGLENAFFPELQVLQLSVVLFHPLWFYFYFSGFVLPKITVLDLSHQLTLPHIEDGFFATLTNLEELYLCGWNFIKSDRLICLQYLKNLTILDLGKCILCNDAISILIQNSASLEELYLCFSNFVDIQRTDDEVFFPRLQSLCVKFTNISERAVREFLTECPSLKFVNVSGCACGITDTSDIYKEFKQKCNFSFFNIEDFCDHFSKRQSCK